MLVFINLDLVCTNFRKNINFEEVMITLCLFIGYQPHICPKNLILVQKVSFLEIDHFDLLDFSKKSYYILSAHIHHKVYVNVTVTPYYENIT